MIGAMRASGTRGQDGAPSGTADAVRRAGLDGSCGRRLGFARWRSDLPSGGNRYDEELVTGLRALGLEVHEYPVTGPWPLPELHERQRLAELLSAEQDWLIGNIVGSAAPEEITAAVAAGRRVTVLMHYFPADDPSLTAADRRRLAASEARAVTAASAVVVTSAWAAGQVASRYGRDDAVVAVPGFSPAALAPGSSCGGGPPTLLWLARLTRAKDPLTFVEALARSDDLGWTARLVGPALDADLTQRVRERIERTGLTDRIAVVGTRDGEALEAEWARTDLLVHTSHTETYGMVVSEALARGIPSIVGSGTGAVEAQEVGETFPPGDVDALTRTLRGWLTDQRLRERWRTDAAVVRAHLPTWSDTARSVATALGD